MREFHLRRNGDALEVLTKEEVIALTDEATRATFYVEGLTPEQVAANRRVAEISGTVALAAAEAEHQHLVAAFAADRLMGFVIATRHAPADLELDWMMVHPAAHGSRVAPLLMREGLAWLGEENPIWLTVLRHNERAIRFYRKFAFEIDPAAVLHRTVPTWIMRRATGLRQIHG